MTYDSLGNSYRYFYDNNDNLTELTTVSATGTLTTAYSYDADNREVCTTTPVGRKLRTVYDSLGRVKHRYWDTETLHTMVYTYKNGADGSKSAQMASLTSGGKRLWYYYDRNGNITAIMHGNSDEGTNVQGYVYDERNCLIRENDPIRGETVSYRYDAGGNLTEKKVYLWTTGELTGEATETVSYVYDTVWKDRLEKVVTERGGIEEEKTMLYDAIGNPTKYGDWNMSWTQRRRLASMSTATGGSLTFAYNEAGIRTKKVDNKNGLTYQYQLAGSKVVGERVTNTSNGSLVYVNQYVYDSAGNIVSMVYTPAGQSAVEYYYVKNGQGDIIGLIDGAGSVVVNYVYDSWGKLLDVSGNTMLGDRNPFRYRGYYYDVEMGLYYLKSRYYDPGVMRFLNADVVLTKNIGVGCNVYAYCINNPTNHIDSNGLIALSLVLGAAIAGAIAGAITGVISYLASSTLKEEDITIQGVLGAVAVGVMAGSIGGMASIAFMPLTAAATLVGTGVAIYNVATTEGDIGQKLTVGVTSGIMAAGATVIGAKLPMGIDSVSEVFMTSYTVSVLVGIPMETLNVWMQYQMVDWWKRREEKNTVKDPYGRYNVLEPECLR